MINAIKLFFAILLGLIYMSLMAFKKAPIPGTSIEMSLQSLSVSTLVIILEGKAFWVILIYLLLATFGFPLLAEGVANAKWYDLPSAGYYFGFLISSYILAKILKKFKPSHFFKAWFLFSFNEASILLCGFIFLNFYYASKHAWQIGVAPYLFGALLKITIATCLYYAVLQAKTWN